MLTALRRIFWLAVVAGAGYAVYSVVERRRDPALPDAPVWPPIPTSDANWVEPVDGACPTSHPLKANATSNIFHQPGGRFYDRTAADRCYARTDDAEADGYRAAKS